MTWRAWWPGTLRARLFVIMFTGLALAYGLSFGLLYAERYMSARAIMLGTLESDLATSIAVLDRLPATERSIWLDRLSRGNYRLVLGPGQNGIPDTSQRGAEIAKRIEDAAGHKYPLRIESIPSGGNRLQGHLTLSDGSPLTIDVTPTGIMPVAHWLPYVFMVQMALLLLCSWLAMRQAVRPLAELTAAADGLDPTSKRILMSESGPREVTHAARAFNAMRDRIDHYLEERVQILAAISHDLQTPITRMRLRADMAEDSPEKDKLVSDLQEIGRLVQDGIAYARSSHSNGESLSRRIDLASFIDSIAYDYQDTGSAVSVVGTVHGTATTKPHALRRILTNFIDNAIKFAGAAEISVEQKSNSIAITVADRGPGIPEAMLEVAMQPFFRLEQSRNRETGGSGLGLAIAQQLAGAIGGSVRLYNRAGGGLAAEVSIHEPAMAGRGAMATL